MSVEEYLCEARLADLERVAQCLRTTQRRAWLSAAQPWRAPSLARGVAALLRCADRIGDASDRGSRANRPEQGLG